MKHFFRVLWSLLSVWQWHEVPAWTKADSEQMKHFLGSPWARILIQRLRNASISMNARAVQNGGSEWACGQAAGFQQCCAYIQTLSETFEESESDIDKSEETVDDLLSRLAP